MPVIGTRQSPIKITTKDTIQVANPGQLLKINYSNRKYHGVFVGEHPSHGNFELDTPPFPKVRFQGRNFELRRIHVHRKSEHMIDTATQRDFEVHFVHAEEGMTLGDPKLVIGILYHESAKTQAGKGLEEFNEILTKRAITGASLTSFKADDPGREAKINPLDFFPRMSDGKSPDLTDWFYYEGSLTSEPYSEDVSWFVMKNESKVDPSEILDLELYAEQAARPPHTLDRRLVLRSFP